MIAFQGLFCLLLQLPLDILLFKVYILCKFIFTTRKENLLWEYESKEPDAASRRKF